ncbi:MAG: flippase-like domain-containing protein [Frankiaceae bacterium]|nr:flippase-like domain-containing protein [Frankiaceae bacterium]
MTSRLRRLTHLRSVRVLTLVVALSVAAFNAERLPSLSLLPIAVGMLPWIVGKYVLCPLRWHAISASGQTRRWHLRVYAESELIGMLSPAHAGADLWRAHKLHATAGMDRPSSFAEVALDRLIGAVALATFVLIAGATLPPQVLLAAVGIASLVLTVALVVRRKRPGLLAGRPRPPMRALVHGFVLSLGYQMTVMCLLLGGLAATGNSLSPLALLGVFGASQVAGIIPGIHGAGPREGALVAGLVALGVPFRAALGAVSITAVVAWLPALLIGGVCLLVGRHARHHAPAPITG